MHPADEIRGSKSNKLLKKRIVLGITGSIASVETVKLSRELIRHGAEVIPVMSPSAAKIIHPDAIWFATGNKPILELTGATEHVTFCGRVKNPADLLLISPCTANTISKIAHGIDDTSVTTFASTTIGSNIPILIVPAMHISMFDHKIVQKNIDICRKIGIKFVEPKIEKNKAKMANINEIVAYVIRETSKKDLANKKILIMGGPTAEPVDDIRIITNRSSGKTAVFLAKNAFYRGADVELWYGNGTDPTPSFIKTDFFESIDDIIKLIEKKDVKKFDVIIICSALSDYAPKKQKGKIKSGKEKILIELLPTPKIIPKIRKKSPKSKIIGFKVEDKRDYLIDAAKDLLKNSKIEYVVANTISGFSGKDNEIWIIDKKGKSVHKKGNKEELTEQILDSIK
jgi:phosphopantothenoylcysteine decarboxylase/phosphopantothenate--cysteine ligase